MSGIFGDLDLITYYGICPYDKRDDQKTWLHWMSKNEVSGMPPAQCAIKILQDAQHYGTVRERVLDDLEGALKSYMGNERWDACKTYLQKEAQTSKKPAIMLQESSIAFDLDLLFVWHCLQSQKPVMKWKKKADIKPIEQRQWTCEQEQQRHLITLACDILQLLSKGKEQKTSLRMKRHAHTLYDDLTVTQKRERVAEALFYNAAQTANLPAQELLHTIFDASTIKNMKAHWQPVQGLIIFDGGKIRKSKAKVTANGGLKKRVKKTKDYLPVLYDTIKDVLLNATHTMSVEMLTNIIVDNYGMPDKHLKEVRDECAKTITKVRKMLIEMQQK